MRIYAIGDLHLPGAQSKPMDVFGAHWEGHFEKIEQDWRSRVQPDDTVLVPGDLSWAMTLEEAAPDLARICALPGRKLLLRGNHDYWWSSLTRVRALLPEGNWALQNDARDIGDAVVCGTRGWNVVADNSTDAQNLKIYRRELMRLELSLKDAAAKAQGRPIVCMLHFPPFGEKREVSGFTQLLEAYGVYTCVYGHLHGEGIRSAFEGERGGVRYKLVSCDSLGFRLHEVEV
ncbi:MAG: metallophosphoesterase [Candidatus Spyradocola sp.]|nr:metallophosphoesterase [Candidatus Spyradocola sp.]